MSVSQNIGMFLITGVIMGRVRVSHQLDSTPCAGSDVNWKVLSQDLCSLLHCKY